MVVNQSDAQVEGGVVGQVPLPVKPLLQGLSIRHCYLGELPTLQLHRNFHQNLTSFLNATRAHTDSIRTLIRFVLYQEPSKELAHKAVE